MKRIILLTLTTLTLLIAMRATDTSAAPSNTITVTDSANDGAGTLRQAILDASDGDTIRFDGDYTIQLTDDLPVITRTLTIDGEANTIIMRGNATTRSGVLLNEGADVTLRNLTMENGSLDFGSNGGAIEATDGNQGTDFAVNGDFPIKLTIEGCTFRNNDTIASFNGRTSNGGAIAAEGTRLIIRDSQFIDNATDTDDARSNPAFGNGGAIYLRNGHLTVERSTFDNNTARNGGAIWIDGSFEKIDTVLHISDSTFEDNEATKPQVTNFSYEGGGAIYFGSYATDVSIRNNLFDGNRTAARGGALRNRGDEDNRPARIENNTFYDNHADNRGGAFDLEYASINNITASGNTAGLRGGGIYAGDASVVRNSILANNFIDDDGIGGASGAANDCSADVTATFANTLVEANSPSSPCDLPAASGNLVGDDPDLSSVSPTANGGETETFALNSGSPAIGAADTANCAATDQRGYLRTGSGCDMGAYEANTAVRCATNDGITERLSFTAEALHLALAADSGNDIKVAGTCAGTTNVGNVIGDSDAEIVSMYIDQSFDVTGGHKVVDWSLAPDGVAYRTVIDALGTGRVAIVAANQTTTFAHLTLQNGAVALDTTGVDGQGGVVYSAENTLTLKDVTLQNGSANSGGLLYAKGTTLAIEDSTFQQGEAFNRGGGLYTLGGTVTTVERSTFANNIAGAAGGAFNLASSSESLTLTNSTISSNVAGRGGGIRLDSGSSLIATNVTIAANDATSLGGGGLSIIGSATLKNTIVSDSKNGLDCELLSGSGMTAQFSLIEDGSCGITAGVSGNAVADPNLSVLGFHSAETFTHALLGSNNPASNTASNASCPSTDQRGFTRSDGACDMGAYEVGATDGVPTAVTLQQSAVSGQQSDAALLWSVVIGLFVLMLTMALLRRRCV